MALKDRMDEAGAKGRTFALADARRAAGGEDDPRDPMDYAGARSLTGYAADPGWLGRNKPALALELVLFGQFREVNPVRNSRSREGKFAETAKDIGVRFPDRRSGCG